MGIISIVKIIDFFSPKSGAIKTDFVRIPDVGKRKLQ
jgi:hypothetical protein